MIRRFSEQLRLHLQFCFLSAFCCRATSLLAFIFVDVSAFICLANAEL